jgi:hypothetical protein
MIPDQTFLIPFQTLYALPARHLCSTGKKAYSLMRDQPHHLSRQIRFNHEK